MHGYVCHKQGPHNCIAHGSDHTEAQPLLSDEAVEAAWAVEDYLKPLGYERTRFAIQAALKAQRERESKELADLRARLIAKCESWRDGDIDGWEFERSIRGILEGDKSA